MPKTSKKTAAAPASAPTAEPAVKIGVIATLKELLQQGAFTKAELYEEIIKRMPERASVKGGVRITLNIQIKKLAAKGLAIREEQIEGRGTVYTAVPPPADAAAG